jgi:hypothetical protein
MGIVQIGFDRFAQFPSLIETERGKREREIETDRGKRERDRYRERERDRER